METKSRLGGADGVRALACLMVMAHHAFQKLALPAQSADMQEWQLFFLTGSAGVAVFFVLSGYLLSSPFWRAWGNAGDRPSLGSYALRRWARIAPAFWLNLVLTFILSLTFVPGAPNLIWRFVAGLTFTSSFTWQTFFPVEINGPLWSIGYEVFSYTLLALFLFLWFLIPGKRSTIRGIAWWLGVLAVTLAIHSVLLAVAQTDSIMKGWEYGMSGGAKYWWPWYNPVGFFGIFVLGVLAAGVTDGIGRKSSGSGSWIWDAVVLALVAGWFLFLWSVRHEPEFGWSWPRQPYYFPIFPAIVAAILGTAPHSRLMRKVLDNPVGRFIATISFGLYIWHYLFLEISKVFWPNMVYFGVRDLGEWALQIGSVYLLAGVVATLSWYFFEKPIVAWSQRTKK